MCEPLVGKHHRNIRIAQRDVSLPGDKNRPSRGDESCAQVAPCQTLSAHKTNALIGRGVGTFANRLPPSVSISQILPHPAVTIVAQCVKTNRNNCGSDQRRYRMMPDYTPIRDRRQADIICYYHKVRSHSRHNGYKRAQLVPILAFRLCSLVFGMLVYWLLWSPLYLSFAPPLDWWICHSCWLLDRSAHSFRDESP